MWECYNYALVGFVNCFFAHDTRNIPSLIFHGLAEFGTEIGGVEIGLNWLEWGDV